MLTVRQALKYAVDHGLRGPLSPHTPALDVVNRALLELTNARSWRCFERTMRMLPSRPSVSLDGATYVASTRTLTLASAFDDYDFVAGDYIEVTASTVSELGQGFVASRPDGNRLVLTEGAAADFPTDATFTTGTLDTARVAAPTDISEVIRFEDSNTLTGLALPVSIAELLAYRTQDIPRSHYTTWFALSYAAAGDSVQPVPIFEIWPQPTSAKHNRYSLMYRAQHREVTSDADILEIPRYLHALFIDLLSAVARGYDGKRGNESMGGLVAQVLAGPVFRNATRRDGAEFRHTGPVKNTAYRGGERLLSFSEGLLRNSSTIITPG